MKTAYSPEFERLLFGILRNHPEGLAEHTLIKILRQQGCAHLPAPGGDHLRLFQVHFILFHHLHRLRERLWRERRACLSIGPLHIALEPFAEGGGETLAGRDPLRDFYLDLSRLHSTTASDVRDWLAAFWRRLDGGEQRRRALATLGLEEPVDYRAVKMQYRRLAMRHHPDRGGDKERLQMINAAMTILAEQFAKGS